MYSIDTLVDCGSITVDFIHDGVKIVDSDLFGQTSDPAFIVKETQDVNLKGDYPIFYKVSLSSYPENSAQSTVPFTITVIDPCDAPVGITSYELVDQEYTVTQTLFAYQIPPFVANPLWCDITYSYSVTDVAGDAAITFDTVTQTFMFDYSADLSLLGQDYTVTVFGKAGNLEEKEDSSTFTLKIKNPCIDPAYLTIDTASSSNESELNYILYDYSQSAKYEFTHPVFTINAAT